MSSIGQQWAGEDNISAARMNAKTVWIGTGTQLSNLSPMYAGQIAMSLDTTGGFSANFVYYRSADNQDWLPLSMSKHTHSADTDNVGGLFSDIVYANVYDTYWINLTSPTATDFLSDSSGGTITNDVASSTGKVRVETGVVTNQYVHACKYGLKLDFSHKSRLSVKMGLDVGTNLVTRVSVCGESTNVGNDNKRKYGIEGCTSTGINWQLFSGNGTARTGNINTGAPLVAGADSTGVHYRLDLTPSVDTKFYLNGVNCGANCTKASNVPSSSDSGLDYVVRIGTKTTDDVNKKIGLWGVSLAGRVSDMWF